MIVTHDETASFIYSPRHRKLHEKIPTVPHVPLLLSFLQMMDVYHFVGHHDLYAFLSQLRVVTSCFVDVSLVGNNSSYFFGLSLNNFVQWLLQATIADSRCVTRQQLAAYCAFMCQIHRSTEPDCQTLSLLELTFSHRAFFPHHPSKSGVSGGENIPP
jgi:hypothetical protein